MSFRIVQWTSGGVARQCVRAITSHPNMQLVGMYAHSPNKVGQDAGTLVGLPPLGFAAIFGTGMKNNSWRKHASLVMAWMSWRRCWG